MKEDPENREIVSVSRVKYPVLRENLLNAREYKSICASTLDEQQNFFDLGSLKELNRHNTKLLGLHWIDGGQIQPSHFVGAMWLRKNEQPLIVRPKIYDHNITVDAVQMFTEVFSHPDPDASMDTIFRCYNDEPAIPGEILPDLSLIQVIQYLRTLAIFCKRDLRLGFIRRTENLTGRIKGKILPDANLRLNTTKGRVDRMVCQFPIISMDTLANRVLKHALELSWKWLARFYPPGNSDRGDPRLFFRWARQAQSALAPVSLVPIKLGDFRGIHYSGLMKRYKKPHALTKAIIQRLRMDPSGNVVEVKKNATMPFWLDMNKLFEAYVGIQLKKSGYRIAAQNKIHMSGDFSLSMIPDFVVQDQPIIFDAKYKNSESSIPDNSDFYQLISYMNGMAVQIADNHHWQGLQWQGYLVLPKLGVKNAQDLGQHFFQNLNSTEVRKLSMKLPTLPGDQSNRVLTIGFLSCPLPVIPVHHS